MLRFFCTVFAIAVFIAFCTSGVSAQENSANVQAELAKKLQNPIADLISLPIQNNWDFGIGPEDAYRYTGNIQPVIPFSISDDWNLITRTILPVVRAEAPAPGLDTHTGLGDTVQSFFFSPKAPTANGWIWGAGPAFYWPTSSNRLLGGGKTGAGPTAVVLKQKNGWTYGALANHIWSFTGPYTSADVNATYLQPFLGFTTKTFTTFTLNTESTYDWDGREWNVPFNVLVAQLIKVGGMPMQFQAGPRFYLHHPDGGADFGLRFQVTLMLPK